MERNFVPSGDGYFIDIKDPSKGIYGIPLEVEKRRDEELKENLIWEKRKNNLRTIKALKLIRESGTRDINYKIHLLKRLGYSNVYVKKNKIKFEEVVEKYYPNIARMYDRAIAELREIVSNPGRKSKLVERLDSIP